MDLRWSNIYNYIGVDPCGGHKEGQIQGPRAIYRDNKRIIDI